MSAFVAVVALAQLGIEQSSSGASAGVTAASPRARTTSVDDARASLPLPRTVAVAPVDDARSARAARVAASAAPPARASRSRGGAAHDVWTALAACESGGNPDAVSSGGRYHGAFQFSVATWQGLGYPGSPTDHPYAVQLEAAQRLQARSGWGQWPRCSRRLGLR